MSETKAITSACEEDRRRGLGVIASEQRRRTGELGNREGGRGFGGSCDANYLYIGNSA